MPEFDSISVQGFFEIDASSYPQTQEQLQKTDKQLVGTFTSGAWKTRDINLDEALQRDEAMRRTDADEPTFVAR